MLTSSEKEREVSKERAVTYSIIPTLKRFSGVRLTLLIFLLLGLCYSYYTPLWNPPDEERHFAYCEYIAQNHTLPEYGSDSAEKGVSMAFHPPLYYIIGSLLCKDDGRLLEELIYVNDGPGYATIVHPKSESGFPYSGKARSAHLLRLFSLTLCALTLYFVYLLVLKIFPGETTLACTVALFVATNPQFVHTAVSVSNDTMAILLSTIYLLTLLSYAQSPCRLVRLMISGVVLGLCLLSKSFTLFFVPVTICIIFWICLRNRTNPVMHCFTVLGIAFLVAGWWYVRNWIISNDPLLSKTAVTSHPWFLRHIPLSLADWQTMLMQTYTSFFGFFGSLQFAIHGFHLIIYGGLILLGIFGFVRFLVKTKLSPLQGTGLGILSLSLLGATGIFIFLTVRYVGLFMGRYLFVVIAPFAIITVVGIWSLCKPRWKNSVLIGLSLVLLLLNLDSFFRVIKPAYAESAIVKGVDQFTFCCPSVAIEGTTTTIAQTFISPHNNLSAIRVMFSLLLKEHRGEILFSLMKGKNTGKVLREIKLPQKQLTDLTRYFFTFPPIQHARGEEFTVSFSMSTASNTKGISLWYDTNNPYTEGSMLVNGNPTTGDLYFTTYHLMGELPQTDWEGRKATVIKQGGYVTLREWQLYQERSKEFRQRTITHEKIIRFEKALKNRKDLISKDNHA
jgi:4-amino-4-deoxy-L-arabinose transferase-like glycosyltransferase